MANANSEFNRVVPIYGKEHDLVEMVRGTQMYGSLRNFKGVFIGKNPNETDYFFRVNFPEGFLFAGRDKEGNLGIYMQRSEVLTEMWLSEGSDGPSWPEGIEVSRFEGKLKEFEKNYLEKILKKYGGKIKDMEAA